MQHTYGIKGVTCKNCAEKVNKALMSNPDITSVEIDEATHSVTITMTHHVPTTKMNAILKTTGDYELTMGNEQHASHTVLTEGSKPRFGINAYVPLIAVFGLIAAITWLIMVTLRYEGMLATMKVLMGVWFIVFGLFKLPDLKGFASTYAEYDLIAGRSGLYAKIYPFIEILLGLCFLVYITHFQGTIVTGITFVLMLIGTIGVSLAVLSKRKIQCACIGTSYELPMSTVTIIEDVVMVLMAGYMFVYHFMAI